MRPFPDNWTSIDDIVEFGRHHRLIGFNRECIRAYIFWRLHQHFRCTSFVETGTLYGHTSGFVRRVFKTPVFTSEINNTYYLVSKANLLWSKGISMFRSNSPDFLRKVCHSSAIGNNPMFYLDAHWYKYMPLPEELAAIGECCEKGIILVDDFFVPSDSRFLYDQYPDLRIDLSVINTTLKARREDVSVYLPAYNPDKDPTGKGIGFAVALMGQERELPMGAFPFNLLAEVSGESGPAGPGG